MFIPKARSPERGPKFPLRLSFLCVLVHDMRNLSDTTTQQPPFPTVSAISVGDGATAFSG